MAKKNYEILSGNILVAVWQDNKLTVYNETFLPLYLRKIQNADMWLETRAIDSHRANSRLLKKALRLTEKDDISTVIHVNGATITDNYWIREIGSNLTYDDVKFHFGGNVDNINQTQKNINNIFNIFNNNKSIIKLWIYTKFI